MYSQKNSRAAACKYVRNQKLMKVECRGAHLYSQHLND